MGTRLYYLGSFRNKYYPYEPQTSYQNYTNFDFKIRVQESNKNQGFGFSQGLKVDDDIALLIQRF